MLPHWGVVLRRFMINLGILKMVTMISRKAIGRGKERKEDNAIEAQVATEIGGIVTLEVIPAENEEGMLTTMPVRSRTRHHRRR